MPADSEAKNFLYCRGSECGYLSQDDVLDGDGDVVGAVLHCLLFGDWHLLIESQNGCVDMISNEALKLIPCPCPGGKVEAD